MVINLTRSHAGVFGNRWRAIQQVVGDGFISIFDDGLAGENASDLFLEPTSTPHRGRLEASCISGASV